MVMISFSDSNSTRTGVCPEARCAYAKKILTRAIVLMGVS
jgi:hypothetical protein